MWLLSVMDVSSGEECLRDSASESSEEELQPSPLKKVKVNRGSPEAELMDLLGSEEELFSRSTTPEEDLSFVADASASSTSMMLTQYERMAEKTQGELRQRLFESAYHGYSTSLVALLDSGVPVNSQHERGRRRPSEKKKQSDTYTALMYACEFGKTEAVEILLSKGADLLARNKLRVRMTALHISCYHGRLSVVKAILAHCDSDKATAVDRILADEQLSAEEKVKEARQLKHGDGRLASLLTAKTKKGWTPLVIAVNEHHIEIVLCLLAYSDNNPVEDGQEAYYRAARSGWLECLQLLVAATDSLSLARLQDQKGWNILHHACASGNTEMLKWLQMKLHNDELLKQKTKSSSYTPLLVACEYQKVETVRYLTGQPVAVVDPEACASEEDTGSEKLTGKTGLHLAAIHDSREIAELLTARGCRLDIQDAEGDTALHIALRKGSRDVVDFLREIPDCDKVESIKNKDGLTPQDIILEDAVPSEIRERGEQAVEAYFRALRHGKKKIPRCNLLVLGEVGAGKSSLIRLLTGKYFKKDLESTRGIDNTIVDTVDVRSISTTAWQEVPQQDLVKENSTLEVSGVLENMDPALRPTQPPSHSKKMSLLRCITEESMNLEIKGLLSAPSASSSKQQPKQSGQHISYHTQELTVEQPPQGEPPTTQSRSVQPPPHTHTPVPRREERQIPPHKETRKPPSQQPRVAPESPPSSLKSSEDEEPEPARQIRRHSGVSRRHHRFISRELKSGSWKKKEPTLHLTTYDFAGQEEYRPMHHCFMSRRAMYIVVFNIHDMVAFMQNESQENPLEEIRYWLNSIHAHIYKGDQQTKPKRVKRVFLIGTRKSTPKDGKCITEDEMSKIHEELNKQLIEEEDHYVDDLYKKEIKKAGRRQVRIFAAVENSLDKSDQREASGAAALQTQLIEESQKLPFLGKEHPVRWLRFESALLRWRQQKGTPKVVPRSRVEELARSYDIGTDAAQPNTELETALNFFHDTGTIVLLDQLPTVFLEEREKDELKSLVLLDPKWLIYIMRKVMELQMEDSSQRKKLRKSGVAQKALLEECWKDYYADEQSFHQLCLILQAYCLIFPIQIDPEAASLSRTYSEPAAAAAKVAEPLRSQSEGVPHHLPSAPESFLIPCMLPEKELKDQLEWISFSFDFQGFLPAEVFHRLVCLMLSKEQKECPHPPKQRQPTLSKSCCKFCSYRKCHWKLEASEEQPHTVKVSVRPNSVPDDPGEFISHIHKEFLQQICLKSGLQGLEYIGGPFLGRCKTPGCQQKGLLPYVHYSAAAGDDAGDDSYREACCIECNREYDVNQVLKEQCPQLFGSTNHNVQTAVGGKPDLADAYRILLPVARKWKNIGTLLKVPSHRLDNFEVTYKEPDDYLREMLSAWLTQTDPSPTWRALTDAVRPFNSSVAQNIETMNS